MVNEKELVMCQCTLVKAEVGKAGLLMCPNCDMPQPQEGYVNPKTGDPFPRQVTKFDKIYRKVMEAFEKEWYPKPGDVQENQEEK